MTVTRRAVVRMGNCACSTLILVGALGARLLMQPVPPGMLLSITTGATGCAADKQAMSAQHAAPHSSAAGLLRRAREGATDGALCSLQPTFTATGAALVVAAAAVALAPSARLCLLPRDLAAILLHCWMPMPMHKRGVFCGK